MEETLDEETTEIVLAVVVLYNMITQFKHMYTLFTLFTLYTPL